MELLQLRYFVHAARTENFSRTAAFFMVPQSSVSQTIKKLEGELGVQLFTRRGNRVFLNEKGRSFYEVVSAALSQIDAACGCLREVGETPEGELRLHTINFLIFRRENQVRLSKRLISPPTQYEAECLPPRHEDGE